MAGVEIEGEIVEAPPRKRWKRPAIVAAVVLFCGIWGFAFWYDATRGTPEPLDPTSKKAAAVACQWARASMNDLEQLPKNAAPTVLQRTTLVRGENTVLTDLVTRLRTVHPSDHDGAKAIAAFATDWEHLVEARARYVAAVLSDAHNPKLVVPVDPAGKPITIRMREYAEIHHLPDCTPTALQGEVVEGPRSYTPAT
jgi:hypothetical protein